LVNCSKGIERGSRVLMAQPVGVQRAVVPWLRRSSRYA
jgi:hypothetical protein